MDDYDNQGMSPARRRAALILRDLVEQQEHQREVMADKTAHLRELRIAKQAAERDKESSRPLRQRKRKPRRRRQPSR